MSTTVDTAPRPRMDPRIARRRVEVRRQEGRRRLRILVACAGVAAAVCLFAGSLWTPLFKVRHVRVAFSAENAAAQPAAGAPQVTSRQVLVAAGLAKERLMIDVNASATARRLDAVPVLGSARVAVDWPGTVKISVVVRRPVVQVPVTTTQASGQQASVPRWATIDATGRVLSVSPSASPGLPVLYGAGPVPALGEWMTGTAGPSAALSDNNTGSRGGSFVDMTAQSDGTDIPSGVSAALAIAASLPPDVEGDVQSISVTSGQHPALTMAVLPRTVAAGSIKVVLGDGSQLSAKLTALATLLTKADLKGVAQIDLTVPDRPAAVTQP